MRKLIKLIVLATLAFVLAAGTVLVMTVRPALCVDPGQPAHRADGGWQQPRVWSVYFCADRSQSVPTSSIILPSVERDARLVTVPRIDVRQRFAASAGAEILPIG